METTRHDSPTPSRPHAIGLRPARTVDAHRPDRRHDGEMRGATLTLVVALYPLIGSVTIVIAALLLAGGALAG
ncbi:MAG: hypothetical protein ACK4U0_15090 [Mesorhizobium sp.]